MQRLFAMFPQGGPGVGLLLLRISVALTLLIDAANRSNGSSLHVLLAGAGLISLLLSIGALTLFVAMIAGATALATFILHPAGDAAILISIILNSAALAFLGPGAYSLDARWFGRRVVVVAPRKHINQP